MATRVLVDFSWPQAVPARSRTRMIKLTCWGFIRWPLRWPPALRVVAVSILARRPADGAADKILQSLGLLRMGTEAKNMALPVDADGNGGRADHHPRGSAFLGHLRVVGGQHLVSGYVAAAAGGQQRALAIVTGDDLVAAAEDPLALGSHLERDVPGAAGPMGAVHHRGVQD